MNSIQWEVTGLREENTWQFLLWQFLLFTFCESLYTPLSFKRARGSLFDEEISIPNWGGHWSYVCAWMCVKHADVCVCMCVCVRMRVCKEWQPLLLYSGNSEAPLWRDKYSYNSAFCHSPADDWVAVCVDQNGKKQNTWCEHAKTRSNWQWRTFLSCHSVEGSCVLSYSVWPALVWSGQKRCDGAPWRFSAGMTSYWNTFIALWATQEELLRLSRCIQRDCCADPKCCMQHLLGYWLSWLYFTQIFLSRSKSGGLWFMNCFISPLLSCQGCAPFL